jgi:hypothetical protein
MKRIEASLDIGYCGAKYETEFEFEDNITEEEIDEIVTEWANNYINIGWKEVE